jgi:uncharacterized membrane protein YhaH (DUF805 family)
MLKKLIRLFSFEGKAPRVKFLRFIPLAIILWFLAGYIDEQFIAPNLCMVSEDWICYLPGEVREGITLDMIVFGLLIIPLFSLFVRRLHDHGTIGWWSLLAVPVLVLLALRLYKPEIEVPTFATGLGVIGFLPLFYLMMKKAAKTDIEE